MQSNRSADLAGEVRDGPATSDSPPATSAQPDRGRDRGEKDKKAPRNWSPYIFCLPYVLLVGAFGVFPALYAVLISFTGEDGRFAGFTAYVETYQDFRYASVFGNIALYGVLFVVPSMVISIGIALLLQGRSARVGSAFRFAYYLPQALAGAAGVVAWIFMLNPATSPLGGLMEALGAENIFQVLTPRLIAPILALIAIWTSANAILLMYAALTSIPSEVVEAARVDGANAWTIAIFIKLPMLKKWIGYTGILNVAAATQLFVEPQILSTATGGAVGDDFSPLQLTYTFAYTYGNFPAAAALSVQLLVIAGVLATIVIKRTDMFRVEI